MCEFFWLHHETSNTDDSDAESSESTPLPNRQHRADNELGTYDADNSDDANLNSQYPAMPLRPCGILPLDCVLADFLGKPVNSDKTRRSAEGNYARDFDREATEVGLAVPALSKNNPVLDKDECICRIGSAKLQSIEGIFHRFVKKLDNHQFEIDSLYNSSTSLLLPLRNEDTWLHALRTSKEELHRILPSSVRSHTVVYDAVAFLLCRGLLNVKGTDRVNIKQGIALLHFADWLQQTLSQRWVREGWLSAAPEGCTMPTLFHALIGGPGTGKTTSTKVISALLEHFYGPECMPQSAPTNTAARLLGGNTVDARYKLPRGSLLSTYGGSLSDVVLKNYRREWQGAVAHNIDELSMLAPNKLHQLDQRSCEATMQFERFMGGLATNASVDFLQLPPVETPSIAMPLEKEGYPIPKEFLPKKGKEESQKNLERSDARWAEMKLG